MPPPGTSSSQATVTTGTPSLSGPVTVTSSSTSSTNLPLSSILVNSAPPNPESTRNDAKPFTVKGVPPGCHDSVKIIAKFSITEEIRKINEEKAAEIVETSNDECYLNRLLQTTDFCARAVAIHPRDVMIDAVHETKRFDEQRKCALKTKITSSLFDGTYINTIKNVIDTVQGKTGSSPDIKKTT